MARIAEAECATCHSIMPKSEMREVAVSRVVGRSSTSGDSSRSGNRRSSTFDSRGQMRSGTSNSYGSGSHSKGTVKTKVNRIWVCKGCRAPKSDGWFLSLLTKVAIVVVLSYFAFNYFSRNVTTDDGPAALQSTLQSSERIASPAPPKQVITPNSEKVQFAPRREVVQEVPSTEDEYPPCSATITDHCTSD